MYVEEVVLSLRTRLRCRMRGHAAILASHQLWSQKWYQDGDNASWVWHVKVLTGDMQILGRSNGLYTKKSRNKIWFYNWAPTFYRVILQKKIPRCSGQRPTRKKQLCVKVVCQARFVDRGPQMLAGLKVSGFWFGVPNVLPPSRRSGPWYCVRWWCTTSSTLCFCVRYVPTQVRVCVIA